MPAKKESVKSDMSKNKTTERTSRAPKACDPSILDLEADPTATKTYLCRQNDKRQEKQNSGHHGAAFGWTDDR